LSLILYRRGGTAAKWNLGDVWPPGPYAEVVLLYLQ
jgi:hypothetical protein